MELINNTNQELEQYKKARKKVVEIKGFYSHLIFYISANLVMIFINLKYSPEYLWFLWPFMGLGVSVMIHAIITFNWIPFLDKNWEQNKIKQFMDEETNNNKKYQ
jgi:uncharacterized membrane protein